MFPKMTALREETSPSFYLDEFTLTEGVGLGAPTSFSPLGKFEPQEALVLCRPRLPTLPMPPPQDFFSPAFSTPVILAH